MGFETGEGIQFANYPARKERNSINFSSMVAIVIIKSLSGLPARINRAFQLRSRRIAFKNVGGKALSQRFGNYAPAGVADTYKCNLRFVHF